MHIGRGAPRAAQSAAFFGAALPVDSRPEASFDMCVCMYYVCVCVCM